MDIHLKYSKCSPIQTSLNLWRKLCILHCCFNVLLQDMLLCACCSLIPGAQNLYFLVSDAYVGLPCYVLLWIPVFIFLSGFFLHFPSSISKWILLVQYISDHYKQMSSGNLYYFYQGGKMQLLLLRRLVNCPYSR